MLEQIMQLVKQFGQKEVVDNPDVPNEYNNEVMAEATHAVTGSLQQAAQGGNMEQLMNFFNAKDDDEVMASPVAQQAQSGFIENITSKLGINKNVAMGLAASLLPMIMKTMVNRTRSSAPQDSGFDLSSLISQFTGGGQQATQQAGGLDIGGLINQFTGGGQASNNGQNGGADISSLIKGFFK